MNLTDLLKKNCTIINPDTSILSDEEFTILRRQGIGASDASVILDTMPFKTKEQLLADKLVKEGITDEERAIGQKPAVRMGKDLEPLILGKLQKICPNDIFKPKPMYSLIECPWLTINYDAITADLKEQYIPVEIKTISIYGEKYYNTDKATTFDDIFARAKISLTGPIEERADWVGIPTYYYAQVQQQMMGLHAHYGVLAALHVKDWTLRIYYVPADQELQEKLVLESYKFWEKVKKLKRAS